MVKKAQKIDETKGQRIKHGWKTLPKVGWKTLQKLAVVLTKAIEDYVSDWALLVDGVVDYLLYPSTPQYNWLIRYFYLMSIMMYFLALYHNDSSDTCASTLYLCCCTLTD